MDSVKRVGVLDILYDKFNEIFDEIEEGTFLENRIRNIRILIGKVDLMFVGIIVNTETVTLLPTLGSRRAVNEDGSIGEHVLIQDQIRDLLLQLTNLNKKLNLQNIEDDFINPILSRIGTLTDGGIQIVANIHYINSLIKELNYFISVDSKVIVSDLYSSDKQVSLRAMKMMQYKSKEERFILNEMLIKNILNYLSNSGDDIYEKKSELSKMTKCLDNNHKVKLMGLLFKKGEEDYLYFGMSIIELLSYDEEINSALVNHIKMNLDSSIYNLTDTVISLIKFVSENRQTELYNLVVKSIIENFNNSDFLYSTMLLSNIRYLPKTIKPKLYKLLEKLIGKIFIEMGENDLSDDDVKLLSLAIDLIKYLPKSMGNALYLRSRKFLLKFMKISNSIIRERSVLVIKHFPKNEMRDLIIAAFFQPDSVEFIIALPLMVYLSEEDRMECVKLALSSVSGILTERLELMLANLSSKNKEIIYQQFPSVKKSHICNEYGEKERRLYHNVGDDFFNRSIWVKREKFEKTGSELFLFGGKLAERVILRVIKEDAFTNWKSLFDNKKIWEEAGFDYVPIESILSFSSIKKCGTLKGIHFIKGQRKVFTEVLDASLAEIYFFDNFKKYLPELHKQRDNIIEVLTELGIQHGHPHFANFCVKFYRNKDGSLDDTRCPRLYLIDFDETESSN